MNIGRNGFEHQHYLVASDNRPEITGFTIPSLVEHFEAKPGLVEPDRCRQVVDDKEGRNAAQHVVGSPQADRPSTPSPRRTRLGIESWTLRC
jgi:hypothetical protein